MQNKRDQAYPLSVASIYKDNLEFSVYSKCCELLFKYKVSYYLVKKGGGGSPKWIKVVYVEIYVHEDDNNLENDIIKALHQYS